MESCQKIVGEDITFPLNIEEFDFLEKEKQKIIHEKNQEIVLVLINFIAIIGGFINSIFFAFESECKIICSLTCFAFSIEYARNNIIQHKQVWQTLKRLGLIKPNPNESIRCEICQMKENCKFSINFEALANVYCYAIKIRMIADYEELLFNNPNFLELIRRDYFNKLEKVINNQEIIKIKCLEG